MNENRFEKVTPEGVYICSLRPDVQGGVGIAGARYKGSWKRPDNFDKKLVMKMINEGVETGLEFHLRNQHFPSEIRVVGNIDSYLVQSEAKGGDKNRMSVPDVYFCRMFLDEGGEIFMCRQRFGISWLIPTTKPNKELMNKMTYACTRRIREYYRENHEAPRETKASGLDLEGALPVYSMTE